jgi:hypothetical protein
MSRVPLATQIAGIDAVLQSGEIQEPVLLGVRATLAWFQNNEAFIKACIEARTALAAGKRITDPEMAELLQHPAVQAVLKQFPDANVASVRDI